MTLAAFAASFLVFTVFDANAVHFKGVGFVPVNVHNVSLGGHHIVYRRQPFIIEEAFLSGLNSTEPKYESSLRPAIGRLNDLIREQCAKRNLRNKKARFDWVADDRVSGRRAPVIVGHHIREEVIRGYSSVPSCFNDTVSFTLCSCNRGYFVEFADRFERRFTPFVQELFGRRNLTEVATKSVLMTEVLVHFEHILWHGLATHSYPRLLEIVPNSTRIKVVDCVGDRLIVESTARFRQPDTCSRS